jgi:hypothetical protein
MGTITTSNGTQIFYKDRGSGQPVLLSHGEPLSAAAWNETMTITDPLTAEVADLHGVGPRRPVRLDRWPVRREVP